MPSPPPRKRARLDHALHKPFRSPLLHDPSHLVHACSPKAAYFVDSERTFETVEALPEQLASARQNRKGSQSKRFQDVSPSLSSNSLLYPALHRALEVQIRTLRSEVDVLVQADRIIASKREDELRNLIKMWKSTARAAAEELFASIKDKVNQMGGISVWRENERRREDSRRHWDQQAREYDMKREMEELRHDGTEEEEQEDGETLEEMYTRMARSDMGWDAKQARKAILEQMENESTVLAADVVEHENERCQSGLRMNDGDEFTMGMMLSTMGIDLDTIGYDKNERSWTD